MAYTIKDVVYLISQSLDNSPKFIFNNLIRKGHPRHYWADNAQSLQFGWRPEYRLNDGILEYANWYKTLR